MEKIKWQDFEKVEIRTGTITGVELFPKAKKPAYKLAIDFGSLGIMKSSAQLTDLYQPSELIGRQIVAVVNFPPKQVADFISECLVLGAVEQDGKVVLLHPGLPTSNGTRIS